MIKQVAKYILNLLPKMTILPILSGKLIGKKWYIHSGNYSNWTGKYEKKKVDIFSKIIKNGDCIIDAGAHVGYYSLLASCLTGKRGRVYSFEPMKDNVVLLKSHININGIRNVKIFTCALAERKGVVGFLFGNSSTTGRLVKKITGTHIVNVKVNSLDNLLKNKQIKVPDIIKIDVEGGEYNVLKGSRTILSRYSPTIFLATHSVQVNNRCIELLKKQGYSCV